MSEIDRRAELEVHVELIRKALGAAETKDVAALLRERRITLAELAEVSVGGRNSVRDEVLARREKRRAAAQAPKAAPRRRNKRSG
jgi:hypothetical protein